MSTALRSPISGLPNQTQTPDQERDSRARTSLSGTSAYTPKGAAETLDPERQPPSAHKLSTNKSNRKHHDLLGVGSQTFNTGNVQYEPHTPRTEETFACPYHRSIIEERLMNPRSGHGLGPMDRYLAERSSERYAILPRPDTRNMSTSKGCRCNETTQSSIDTNDHVEN